MICTEDDYRAGVKELSGLIEHEYSLDAAALRAMSDLADALIAFEQESMKAEERMTATPAGRAEYAADKRGEHKLIAA